MESEEWRYGERQKLGSSAAQQLGKGELLAKAVVAVNSPSVMKGWQKTKFSDGVVVVVIDFIVVVACQWDGAIYRRRSEV